MTNSSQSDKSQKVVLITGASSGIGKTGAEHLASRGYRVFGTQRRAPESGISSGRVEMIQMNVDDDESVDKAVKALVEKTGRIDALVNNAGFALMGPVEDTSSEEAKAQMETNFFGVLRVCRAVLPIMRKQGEGYIINISSLAAVLGLPFSGMYCASKSALECMTESLRIEVRRFGIRVTLIEPGDFKTSLPTARRVTAGTRTNDAYRKIFEQFKAAHDKDETDAPTPEPIAYLIERILRSPNPRTRYSVGMMGQRIVVPLKRYLPQRLFEWALSMALGL